MHTTRPFPQLDPARINPTQKALHAYALILGSWMSACQPKRKHWWHLSLRPSLSGFVTPVVRLENIDFELEIHTQQSTLLIRTSNGEQLTEPLHGQSAAELAVRIRDALLKAGVTEQHLPTGDDHSMSGFVGYSPEQANLLGQSLHSTAAAMQQFQAGITEETSPVQLWPHHFDLAMMWLPGEKIPEQDPTDEEQSDKQMNVGFTFGDHIIAEPYFYTTAYPLPEKFSSLLLPDGTNWHTEGFTGAVTTYQSLLDNSNGDPTSYLLSLWGMLFETGRTAL